MSYWDRTLLALRSNAKYETVEKIREGGMGAIFKVRHRGLGVDRVVKVIRPEHEGDEALRARFKDEARAAAQLTHPNVVRIHDLTTDGEYRLIEMEHIVGADLGQLVQSGRLPSLPVALEIARQCLRALGYLHKNGFVHRDVSPDNFMLTLDADAQPLVKLIDLGIAKHPGGRGTNVFLGKLRYASPEHFGPPERIEQRSDVYAFGIVLYELLTGRHPLCDDPAELAEAVNAHLKKTPRSFDATDPNGRVPEKLRRIVLSTLGKSPEERPESADAFGDAIAQLQTTYPLTEDNRQEVRRLLAAFKPVSVGSDDETQIFPGPPTAVPARKTDAQPARSPFIPGPPIERDEDFFGRRAQRELLRAAVEAGQSVQILGERRMGKTSLLHWVKRHAPDWLDEPRSIVWIVAQGLPKQSPEALVLSIAEALGRRSETERDLARRAPGSVLNALLPMLLLVDEASALALPDHGFDPGFLGILRSFCQERKLLWISSAIRDLRTLFEETGLTSPFLNDARTTWVGQLEDEAARQIVARLDDAEAAELALSQAAGFAYGLQWIADALWRGDGDAEATIDDFSEALRPDFESWWSSLGSGDQSLLKDCLRGVERTDLETRFRRRARILERQGLLVEREGRFTLPGAAWQDFVENV